MLYRSDPAMKNVCAKFHQDSSQTERLVCVATDRQTDGHNYIDCPGDADLKYKSF